MVIGRIKAVLAAGITIIFLICSCEDMTSLFPAGRNYRLSARGEDFSLDKYAVLKKGEPVEPFFVYPFRGDPDIAEVMITIKDAEGISRGGRIRYALASESGKNDKTPEKTAAETDLLFIMDDFYGDFPAFPLPEDLESGAYTMTLHVLGRNQVEISKTEQGCYYVAENEYAISGISAYMPGDFPASRLIPPGTTILLEAEIDAAAGLEPYIFWYNGKTRIGEGAVSGNVNRLLWEVPPLTGFQAIRAELLPFPELPGDRTAAERSVFSGGSFHRGKTRELSLPVSAGNESGGADPGPADSTFADSGPAETFAAENQGKVIGRFALAGNLADSLVPGASTDGLVGLPGRDGSVKAPRWLPAGDVYGLQTGPGDLYRLSFDLPAENNGITAAVRFSPVNDGVCFNLHFDSVETGIRCVLEEGVLAFLASPAKGAAISVEIPREGAFVTFFLNFTRKNNAYTFSLGDKNGIVLVDEITLNEEFSSAGSGAILFGEPGSGTAPVTVLDEAALIAFGASGGEITPETAPHPAENP